jgi:hypothetical protein
MVGYFKEKIEEFIRLGSFWTVSNLEYLEILYAKYLPYRGNSYIALPEPLKGSKSLKNPLNHDDNQCFKWAILLLLLFYKKEKHIERVNVLKRYEHELN